MQAHWQEASITKKKQYLQDFPLILLFDSAHIMVVESKGSTHHESIDSVRLRIYGISSVPKTIQHGFTVYLVYSLGQFRQISSQAHFNLHVF